MRNIRITLNTGEQKMVEWLTKARTLEDVNKDSHPTLWGEYENTAADRLTTSQLGFGGEFAFCKMFNLYPDTSTEYRRGGCDAYWRGLRVDVKTVGTPGGALMVKQGRETKADLWILMYGDYPTYTFKGYTTTDELMKHVKNIKGHSGMTYIVEQDDLFWLDQTDHFSYYDLSKELR